MFAAAVTGLSLPEVLLTDNINNYAIFNDNIMPRGGYITN
jgi:hypothetical protein